MIESIKIVDLTIEHDCLYNEIDQILVKDRYTWKIVDWSVEWYNLIIYYDICMYVCMYVCIYVQDESFQYISLLWFKIIFQRM